MRKLTRFLIGGAVLFFGFLITDNMEFLMMSIICTGGITLVGYVPLAYVIGLAFDELLFKHIIKTDEATQPAKIISINESTAPLTNNQVALVNYIKEARANGMGDGQISGVLKDNGWSEDDIKTALGCTQTQS
ncbi:MAG: hypothetical protein COU40_02235 [Candidatus Moranbacteria bacterium CG10_big_fil_rev_8_21_14_0_10_35_21]|nr:MAG: hypothetical protein COU40_02235 [Candidatus Moranbacteria bacterium CG10_big_fil_rev_8_21_14_0_10_35_21]PJA88811.1 MAG: hypothetical protein CO139_01080 [Candidatus Moranbacteria bacterium CG_4_9_14_3_um_filter_36_9]